jgi:hypothetical protein
MISEWQSLKWIRRNFQPEHMHCGFWGAMRGLMTLWIVVGLVICVERMPDLSGHSHAHGPDHVMDSWHHTSDEVSDHGSTKPVSGFHFHVVKDFTSIDGDMPASAAGVLIGILPTRDSPVDDRLPEPPVLEKAGPPIIGWV